jgi:hypothetical protein
MRKLLIYTISVIILSSCQTNYREGDPVVTKKEALLWPGTCRFTYEGNGQKETFEDDCDKYSIGDKLFE